MGKKKAVSLYQMRITLVDSDPPIWRQLLVASDTTLYRLHHIIQNALGWEDAHLHQFIVGEVYYGVPHPEDWHEVKDERDIKLSQIVPGEPFMFIYEYDFGDSWLHAIQIEKILPPDPSRRLPVCLAGERACPPEDAGGIWGYTGLLEAIQDPTHEEHEDYLDWIGGDFDPEAFDLDETNTRLRGL